MLSIVSPHFLASHRPWHDHASYCSFLALPHGHRVALYLITFKQAFEPFKFNQVMEPRIAGRLLLPFVGRCCVCAASVASAAEIPHGSNGLIVGNLVNHNQFHLTSWHYNWHHYDLEAHIWLVPNGYECSFSSYNRPNILKGSGHSYSKMCRGLFDGF